MFGAPLLHPPTSFCDSRTTVRKTGFEQEVRMRRKYGMVAVGVIAAAAVAAPGASAANGNGNQGCEILRAPGQEFKNPGKMFQYLRNDSLPDTNPKSVVNAFPE